MPLSNRDKQHNEAFGYHIDYFTDDFRREIQCIRDDVPFINFDVDSDEEEPKVFCLSGANAREFTNLAWELLGRYIANNTILEYVGLECVGLTDEKMSQFFGTLINSDSVKELDLDYNTFGIDGLRCMMPFLNSCASQLTKLLLGYNNGIDTECFELLVQTLQNGVIEELNFTRCNIEDISVLETCVLPNLTRINLDYNNVGREGCIIISNLLQKEGSALKRLNLDWTGSGDEEAEILANSLKHNTTLESIYFRGNDITDRGYRAFLKLVVGISSIESTRNSNHTLLECALTLSDDDDNNNNTFQIWINRICGAYNQRVIRKGDTKIINFQLNSQNRKALCHFQGVEFTSIGNLLADIEPVLLPMIIEWIGRCHGQSEIYTALQSLAPDLLSFVDIAMLKDRITSLTKELANLNSRIAFKELGDGTSSVGGSKGEESDSGKNKRQRSASS